MKNKPLIFPILSALCLIEPLIKIFYFKVTTQFDFGLILANIQARNTFIEVIDFWLIFPIAGMLILRLRKWTYFSFLAVLFYINYKIFTYEKYTWPYNSDSPLMYHYIVALSSIALFIYMLLPKVREPFFDKRVRWWEPRARYNVNISCKLHSNNLTYPAQILNISQSGAFVEDSKYIRVGDSLIMEFNFLGQTISVPVEVVNKHTVNNHVGFGLKFNFKTMRQSSMIIKVVKILKKSQSEFQDESTVVA